MSLIIRKEEEKEEDEACMFAMSMAYSAMSSYILKALVELGVLEIIKRAGPSAQLSSAEIVAELPTANPEAAAVLDRMLRFMASHSLLTFSLRTRNDGGGSEEVYGLAPVTKYFTKNEDGVSLAPFPLLVIDSVFIDVWKNLKDTVIGDGEIAFKKTHGMEMFEYTSGDPRFRESFYNAMNSHSSIVLKNILETYNGFQGLPSLVDVGGGIGDSLRMILSKYPTIKAINFDLPHVILNAPSYPGVEHVEGDMYVSIPKADAIFMKWTLHTASDEKCLKLLKNCYAALPEQGKVIACEFVAPDSPEPSHWAKMTFGLDNIMGCLSGGRERTKHEFQALGKQAGFHGFHLVSHFRGAWLIEFVKIM